MYSELARASSGFGERRITARTIPSTMPIAIAITVSSIVTRRPSRIRSSNRYSPTTSHWKPDAVTIERTSAAATRRMIAAAIQRPGCRTGTAFMSSGRPVWLVASDEDTGVLL